MIVVQAGNFMMGSPDGKGGSEQPQHSVTIAKPFAVSKYELTFAEWDACAIQGRCTTRVTDSGFGAACQPVINVSWSGSKGIRRLAFEESFGNNLSPAVGRPIRICGARGNANGLSLGERDQPQRHCDGQLRRLRQQMGRSATGSGRFVRAERVWSIRHGGQRFGVD